MNDRVTRFFALCTLLATLQAAPALALAGPAQDELNGFVRTIREDKRIDQIGYVVKVQIPVSKTSERRIFELAGKYFYQCGDGYLTHVNYSRLERIQKSKLTHTIIDKKRLDDTTERWYLVWTQTPSEAAKLVTKFDPLFSHEHTSLVRIREADEEFLVDNRLHYSVVDEVLWPLKAPGGREPTMLREPDPIIKGIVDSIRVDELVAIVQTLENCFTRYVRTPGNASATTWLADEFRKIPDLDVATPLVTPAGPDKYMNVVAIKPGLKDPKTAYVVCGHFDSISGWGGGATKAAPGADDNGTGTAGVLGAARALAAIRLPFTVIFACWNAEEIGLVGSKAGAVQLAQNQGFTIKAVFNMDMLADMDDNEVAVIGNSSSNWLIDIFKQNAELYVGLQSKTLYDSNIWASDHSSFWNIGVPAILTIEGYPEMSAFYHKTTDLVVNFKPTLMEKIVRSNVAALLSLNTPLPAEEPAPTHANGT